MHLKFYGMLIYLYSGLCLFNDWTSVLNSEKILRGKHCEAGFATMCDCREGTNIEVRVEIEAQPRAGRQPSLSSVLSSRSLSAESVHQSHDPLGASQRPVNEDAQPITQADNVWSSAAFTTHCTSNQLLLASVSSHRDREMETNGAKEDERGRKQTRMIRYQARRHGGQMSRAAGSTPLGWLMTIVRI